MQSLPSELKHLIVELSSGSPASLAALARTHTSFQREAEKALYDTISIFIGGGDSLKCMEILATNPKKAALVHFLIIEFSHATFQSRKVMFYLSKSLINMHSLSDFRVRSCPGDEVEMKGLNEIVWSVFKILIPQTPNSNHSAGDIVEVIFNYTPFTSTTFPTFFKSLRVKPNCKYLDYISLEIGDTF